MTVITKTRIQSIDLLKGLVMVIMALDHVRDYFHYSAFFFDPTDPTQSTLPIFFTRFITHFCAPSFSFLAGLSAYMIGKRKPRNQLSSFLLKRGLWLVFVEIVLINFGWKFDVQFRHIGLQTIWSLGVSMIVLAGLIHLPKKAILIFSLVIIFGHNLLDNIHFDGSYSWAMLHERQKFEFIQGHYVNFAYSLLPWIAVMSFGYCFGPLYETSFDAPKRKKILNGLGIGSWVLFAILIALNAYGDPVRWTNYGDTSKTLMSIFNVNKYPPSLLYLLITLGLAFLFLANAEKLKGKVVNFFCVFGRVPFFYYIIHIYLIHLFAAFAAYYTGFGWQALVLPSFITKVETLKGYGSIKNCDAILNSLSDEQLQKEIATGKNRGIYLLGHLIAVHDHMLLLLDMGEKLYPQLNEPFIKSPDKAIKEIPSAKDLRSFWVKQCDVLQQKFDTLKPQQWFEKHTAVSAKDFVTEPHRNKLNIIVTRTSHLQYHSGQLVLLK